MEGEGQPKKRKNKQAPQEAVVPLPEASPFPQLLRRVKAQLSRMRCGSLLDGISTEDCLETGLPCVGHALGLANMLDHPPAQQTGA